MSCLADCGCGAGSSSENVPDDLNISALQTEICGNFSKETTDKLIARMDELLHKLDQKMKGENPNCNQVSSSSVPVIDNTYAAAVSTGGKVLGVLSNCIHNEMPKQKWLEFKKSARKAKRHAMNALTSGTGKLVLEILKEVDDIPYVGIAVSVAVFVLEHMDKMHDVDHHQFDFLQRMWSMMTIINNVQNDVHRDKCHQMFKFVLQMSISILNKIQTTSRIARFVFSHMDAADLQDMETKFAAQHQDLMANVIISIRNDTPQVNPPSQTVTLPTTFGIQEAIEQVKTELQMGETSKKIVYTIFGLGGMGKTTLAEEVTNSLSLSNYKFCRLYIDLNSSNIATLQTQLLRDVFSTNLVVNNPSEGKTYISDAIQKNKEVKSLYIFIDNALKDKHIEDLLPIETLSEAPLKIRILITTRDSNKIPSFPRFENKIYPIRQNSAAKEILCYHAVEDLNSEFPQMKEVDEVLKMCEGIPLIIKLAGRQLAKHENKAKICREMKPSLLQVDKEQIVDFVYEHLSDDSKEAFLDISFFFLGGKKWKLASMYTESVIKELENAALITTDKEGRVRMHDILRERAHKLSRGSRISDRSEWEEAIQNVEKLKTIQALKLLDVNSEDINNVNKCRNLTKLFLVPAYKNSRLHMKLRLPSSIKVLSIEGYKHAGQVTVTVEPLKHLEVLKLKCVNVEGSLNNITKDELAFVELVDIKDDHSSVFSLGNYPCLRHLRLSCAVIEKFRSNSENSRNLESLKLDSCERLREIESGIWKSTNLRRLNLRGCCKLENLHERIVDLQSVQVLDLSGCTLLQRLPETFGTLKCLKSFSVNGCERLESLPESFGELSSLESLLMNGCSGLVSLCDSFCKLSRLEVLNMDDCKNLRRLPESFGGLHCLKCLNMRNCKRLETLPESFGELSSLDDLDMYRCSGLMSLCDSFGKLSRLEVLSLQGCTNLSRLPESFGGLQCLKSLKMRECKGLESLPDSFCKLSRLEMLNLSECEKLQRLPVSFGQLSSVVKLHMYGCTNLKNLCDSFCKLVRLEELDLSGCKKLQRLPESFGDLQCLKKLVMSECNGLEFLPESFPKLSSLQFLEMDGCCSLVSLCDDFGRLSRLEKLGLTGCKKLERLPESFGHLSSLEKLNMISCEGLKCLPKSFGQLSRLMVLYMKGCIGLKGSLDILHNLLSLRFLILSGCSGLEKLPEDLDEFLPCLLVMDMRGCDELIRNTDLSKLVTMQSLLIILHSTSSHSSLLRPTIHVTKEVLGAPDHIIEDSGSSDRDSGPAIHVTDEVLGARDHIIEDNGSSDWDSGPAIHVTEEVLGAQDHIIEDSGSSDWDSGSSNWDSGSAIHIIEEVLGARDHIIEDSGSSDWDTGPAIHVTEEVLGARDHIIEDSGSSDGEIVLEALKQCHSALETLLKGKGGGGYMKMEEGGEMVWKDAASSDVLRDGAKVVYFIADRRRCLGGHSKKDLQVAVDAGYEVVLVDDGICRWKRHVVVEGKKLEGEVPWNEEDKQMMVEMLSQLPHGCATVWTSPYPKICLLLTLLLFAWPSLFRIQLWDEWDVSWMTGSPNFHYGRSGEKFIDFVCSMLNVKDIVE